MVGKKKMAALASIMLSVSLIATACGSGSKSADSAKSGDKVSLRFMISNDEPNLENEVKDFETQNPNIDVQFEKVPWQQFFDKVETMVSGGREPDILYTPVLATGRYANLGLLLDLTNKVSKEDQADIIPASLATVQYNGKIYGMPQFTDDIAVFYNKAMFEKAGIKPPTSLDQVWNWDEFLANAEKLKQANNVKYGFAIGSDVSQWLPFLYQNKGTVLNDTQKAGGINNQAGIESIKYLKSWFDKGLAPKETFIGSEKAEELFKQGQLPMVITNSGLYSQLQQNASKFQVGVTYMPKKQVVANKLGGYNIVAFKTTKHPDEAAKLILFLTNKEQMSKFASAKGVVPTRLSAQKITDYGDKNEGMEVIKNEINAVPTFAAKDFSLPEYLGYKSILTSELQMAVLGQKSPEQTAKDISDQINRSVFK